MRQTLKIQIHSIPFCNRWNIYILCHLHHLMIFSRQTNPGIWFVAVTVSKFRISNEFGFNMNRQVKSARMFPVYFNLIWVYLDKSGISHCVHCVHTMMKLAYNDSIKIVIIFDIVLINWSTNWSYTRETECKLIKYFPETKFRMDR